MLTVLLLSLATLFILYYLPPVLTIILRRVYKVKGPLKNIIQHIKSYIMYVNMAYVNAVAFKLTLETINTLVKLHQDIYSDVNRFIFYTNALALEGIDKDGIGELLRGRSNVAKAKVKSLFILLQPLYPKALRVLYAWSAFPIAVVCLCGTLRYFRPRKGV
ncbi:hypothetical protein V8F44DRAFT_633059 [Aspergillus fumigatus]